ncbi:MAG: tryptophan 2,3-dioxygenase family protein [Bacteroidota bacterium]|nr:tryptophan 2,3-dioxygenase [Candidatus Kapabacteria bacterium]MDW8219663.1 tryptophan 2,3-dioxygenase family protein [Bacteroidota bacterium]
MEQQRPLYYADYLHLSTILAAQIPRSGQMWEYQRPQRTAEGQLIDIAYAAHDEMLFIITHQAYELWFKQILHELEAVLHIFSQNPIPEHDVAKALHHLERIVAIGPILFQQIDVLETMTPMDFLDFRNVLYPASGFQSVQFRLIEIKLGLTREQRVLTHMPLSPEDKLRIEHAEHQPSLFSLVELWLERMPFIQKPSYSFWQEYQQAVERMFAHERAMIQDNAAMSAHDIQTLLAQTDMNEQSFRAFFDEEHYESLRKRGLRRLSFRASQAALFILLYREYPMLHLPFRLLQALIAIDENFSVWRYRHAQMAMRMIGTKVGTGGSSGFEYLMKATAQHRIFSDFSALSAFLIPRSSLPPLPQEIASMLTFVYIERQEQELRAAKDRAASEYVKTQLHHHFPDGFLMDEQYAHGVYELYYTFPDEESVRHALAFITPLLDAMSAEYNAHVRVHAIPVHAASSIHSIP